MSIRAMKTFLHKTKENLKNIVGSPIFLSILVTSAVFLLVLTTQKISYTAHLLKMETETEKIIIKQKDIYQQELLQKQIIINSQAKMIESAVNHINYQRGIMEKQKSSIKKLIEQFEKFNGRYDIANKL